MPEVRFKYKAHGSRGKFFTTKLRTYKELDEWKRFTKGEVTKVTIKGRPRMTKKINTRRFLDFGL
jgi:hypothetical protein